MKSEDVHQNRNVRRARNLVEMVPVNWTIRVFVNQDGSEECAIKINHGLERLEFICFVKMLKKIGDFCCQEKKWLLK